MHHVVSFSGGVGSWAAARRLVDQGVEPTLVIANTNYEADDWRPFVDACITDLACPVVWLDDGRSIWDVFHQHRFLGNTRVDLCSRVLKRERILTWLTDNCDPEDTTLYLGFDWTEEHRHERAKGRWLPWQVDSPLIYPPHRWKHELLEDLTERGIAIPALYTAGFPHNNCGGACVKAGQAQWAKLLDFDRARYLDAEGHEQDLRDELGDIAILRDRRGGTTKPMTLRVFRARLEGGDGDYDRDDWGACSCMEPVG